MKLAPEDKVASTPHVPAEALISNNLMGTDRLTLHTKAGTCLAACTSAGSDVDHARLLALGAVRGLRHA